MDSQRERFDTWLAGDATRAEAVPAATAILLRDASDGVEVLLVRRNSTLAFAGGLWVFPGGRIDPPDYESVPGDVPKAARRAAAREAAEEAGIAIDSEALIWFSHWTPPPVATRRFATWFFVGRAPEEAVRVDGAEIRDHGWMKPARALRRRDALEIELAPPTWISLYQLERYTSVDSALAELSMREPEFFETRIAAVEGGAVALYHGDAAYADQDLDRSGARHRLWMLESGWRYERADYR